MEKYEIAIIDLNTKTEAQISVEVDEAEETENFVISALVYGKRINAEDDSYFSAYQNFRDKLLQSGFGIKCNGSRINAVQSGMMGITDKVYLVELGKQAKMKDIVYLWDYADIDIFPDTKQQLAFFEQWTTR